MMRNVLVLVALLGLGVAPSQVLALDFVHEVLPILRTHCADCHSGGKKKGGLDMNSRASLLNGGEGGEVVIPGKAALSHIMERIASDDEDEWMPPKGPRVSKEEQAILVKWIDGGLEWPAGITLGESGWEPPLKPRLVGLPPVRDGREHPIDRLLDADLAKRGATPPPPAAEATFLRRAYMDVIGLLPTPDELDSFMKEASADKREKLVETLLARDVDYADHWLTAWNDLLRNDYTGTGFITGGRKQITPWLYEALRTNKPYDEFVRELISPTEASAGFINGIKWRGEVNASQTRDIQFAQNISQVFLGINMKCASCHDSFIDRWTLSEAYNLAAIYSETPLELTRCDKPTGKMATPKWIFPELGDVDPKASKAERLRQLAGLMTHRENGRLARTVVNRIWHRLMGRGIVHPVDAMDTKPWNEDLLDYLAVWFDSNGHDLRGLIRFIMTSEAYQSEAVVMTEDPGENYVYAGPLAKRMTAEQLMDAIWQITGTNPTQAQANVDRNPRAPVAIKASEKTWVIPNQVDAKWIWHAGAVETKSQLRKTFELSEVPPTAMMMATCDNAFVLRLNGKRVAASREWTKPIYRDLAPYLTTGENLIEVDAEMFGGAAGFVMQFGFVEKGKERFIKTDKTWEAKPPKGKSYAAAKELHVHGNGPWKDVLKPANAAKGETPDNQGGPPIRAALVKNDFLMRSLGRPHRDQVVTTRPSELTTLQAIDLSNGDILAATLGKGARALAASQSREGEALATWLYEFALSRAPTDGELEVLAEIAGQGMNQIAVEDLLWITFMQPEFQMIR